MNKIWLSITILVFGLTISGQTVERKYDRFKDKTEISIPLGKTGMDANFNSLSLSLTAVVSGEVIPSDPPVFMSLVITSREWKLLRADLTLRAIVDGERITVGEFTRNYSNVYRGATMEGAIMPVTTATLRKLVDGKKVEFQFLGSETTFTQGEIDRIKMFLDALKN